MSKVRYNTIADAMQGRVGVVVFRRILGKLFASNRPNESTKAPTSDQLAQRVVFASAATKAHDALRDDETRAVYERAAAVRQSTAFGVAMGECFRPPEVPEIDMELFTGEVGGKIKIRATADAEVKSVQVVVRQSDGTALEQGAAIRDGGYWWYTCTTAIPAGTNLIIEVTAKNWMGKIGMKNLNYP